MTIDELLENEGVDSDCVDCDHYMEDAEVDFAGCNATGDFDCPRIPDE